MLKKIFVGVTALLVGMNLNASQATLKFYCGTTMVKPMLQIAKVMEKKHNCKIDIVKGGSGKLFKTIKSKKDGDLFLPGSDSYRKKATEAGILADGDAGAYVGFNQAAVFVRKGNPKGVKTLNDLTKSDVRVVLCDPKSGSIGKQTASILKKSGLSIKPSKDAKTSSGVTNAIKTKKADAGINWIAAGMGKNAKKIEIIKIDEKFAPKKKLVINLLKFSKHPEIAKDFMNYAASADGQKIMKKAGFLE